MLGRNIADEYSGPLLPVYIKAFNKQHYPIKIMNYTHQVQRHHPSLPVCKTFPYIFPTKLLSCCRILVVSLKTADDKFALGFGKEASIIRKVLHKEETGERDDDGGCSL